MNGIPLKDAIPLNTINIQELFLLQYLKPLQDKHIEIQISNGISFNEIKWQLNTFEIRQTMQLTS